MKTFIHPARDFRAVPLAAPRPAHSVLGLTPIPSADALLRR
ncbi:hypothetical protein ACFWVC_28330 [Streptomyces sp. NPDC058691]